MLLLYSAASGRDELFLLYLQDGSRYASHFHALSLMTCSAQGTMCAVPNSLQLYQDSFVGFISAGVYHAFYLCELHPPFISGSLISLCLHVEVWLYALYSHSIRDVATWTVCPYVPLSSSSCNWRPHGVTNRFPSVSTWYSCHTGPPGLFRTCHPL